MSNTVSISRSFVIIHIEHATVGFTILVDICRRFDICWMVDGCVSGIYSTFHINQVIAESCFI
jgi:hypothetical protein